MNKAHHIKAKRQMAILLGAFTLTLAIFSPLSLVSCNSSDSDDVEKRVTEFAHNYFNLRLRQASSMCTEPSLRWIKYRAANITQTDLDVLDAQTDTATCQIDDINIKGDSATVSITVNNFLLCDSIGKPGRICKEAQMNIPVKKVNKVWLVDIDRLI